MAERETEIIVANPTDRPRPVFVEPWCYELTVAPRSELRFVLCDGRGQHQLIEHDDRFVLEIDGGPLFLVQGETRLDCDAIGYTQAEFGRVLITSTEFHLRRRWGLFGPSFTLPLDASDGWSVLRMELAAPTPVVVQSLLLHHGGDITPVVDTATRGRFDELVAYLRYRLGEKEVPTDENSDT